VVAGAGIGHQLADQAVEVVRVALLVGLQHGQCGGVEADAGNMGAGG
jgi:hypothetical protein